MLVAVSQTDGNIIILCPTETSARGASRFIKGYIEQKLHDTAFACIACTILASRPGERLLFRNASGTDVSIDFVVLSDVNNFRGPPARLTMVLGSIGKGTNSFASLIFSIAPMVATGTASVLLFDTAWC